MPADASTEPGALRLTDSAAFGTGLHPTTAMCLEAIEEALQHSTPGALLDVGTGSGVLALAGLLMSVPRALALDIDAEALCAAAENARLVSTPSATPAGRCRMWRRVDPAAGRST